MKNKKQIAPTLKGAFTFLFMLTLGLGQALFSQEIVVNTMANDGQEVPLKHDTVTQIVSFSAKQVQDTAYLCWKVQDMHKNGAFILYRSGDGIHFNIIGTKKVLGVPIRNPIAHYFKDTFCGYGTKYYRLVYISSSSEYLISEKIIVNANPALKITEGSGRSTGKTPDMKLRDAALENKINNTLTTTK